MFDMTEMLRTARAAKDEVASLTTEQKNDALVRMADELEASVADIIKANERDVAAVEGRISPVMTDRLRLDAARITAMADGMRDVAKLPDPVGRIITERTRVDGLNISKISVPLGVIAIIYESRPNVTSDAAALALKSGNVCILRSGKDAANSAKAIVAAMRRGLRIAEITENAINLVEDTTHESAQRLMTANGYIDLLIPRGGAGLINACVKNATVPCIATGTGICHVYVEKTADIGMALRIVENAKTSRPSVCNAEEVLLVDRAIASEFLPVLKETLVDKRAKNGLVQVELRLDRESAAIIDGIAASDADFDTEFLDYILAVKIVSDVKEAVSHISAHSTGHSESIITRDEACADYFVRHVDSAAVYVNASTRFTDGGEFGFGCEMGISTQKLHARGPMGLCELNTYKYVIRGDGHIR